MEIVQAEQADLPEIMALYDTARGLMRSAGNFRQWINGYPQRELIEGDIASGSCWLCRKGTQTLAVFCLRPGPEESYGSIREGAWLDEEPYWVIHRLGSSGAAHGMTRRCIDWCFRRCGNLRADTHLDNQVMRHLLEENGFVRCGVVTIEDGTERIAYQKIR